MTKYRAIKTVVDGITFDSKKEAKRYSELKIMEKAGIIATLRLQPEFKCMVKGKKVCTYKACLLYTSPSPRDGLLSRMPSSA